MCSTCYRFLSLYSKTDSLELEKKSKYTPISDKQLRQAIDMAKAPFIEASEAAEAAYKAAAWDAAHTVLSSAMQTNTAAAQTRTNSEQQVRKEASVSSKPQKRKRRGWRWYHWLLLLIFGPTVFEFVGALIVYLLYLLFS